MSEVVATSPITAPVDAPAPDAKPTDIEALPPSTMPKTVKLKVDGAEVETPFEEVLRLAQLNKAGYKKFEEAAKLRKEAEDMAGRYNKNLKEVLKERLAQNPESIKDLEDIFADYIEEQRQTPEQKEAKRQREELEMYKKKAEEFQKNQEAQQFEQLQAKSQQVIGDMITSNLKTSGLPQTPYTIKRVAEYMSVLRNAGYKLQDINMKDVTSRVWADYNEDFTQMISPMEGDKIIQMLGKGAIEKIRKAELARIKGKLSHSRPTEVSKKADLTPPAKTDKKFMSAKDFDKHLAELTRKR